MKNGHRLQQPDEWTLLVDISRSLGRVEGRLDSQDRILIDTARRVRRLEVRTTMKTPSPFRQWADVLKLLWPFLMLIAAVTSRVLSGDVGWLMSFLEHVKIQ